MVRGGCGRFRLGARTESAFRVAGKKRTYSSEARNTILVSGDCNSKADVVDLAPESCTLVQVDSKILAWFWRAYQRGGSAMGYR